MADWKTVRLFISSTFQDMQAERDYLRDHIFPILDERLKERFCHLEPIDLRWGVDTLSVAEVEAKEMLVLKVCLAEIERSRPFLIALIGDRYGWIPPQERITAAAQEAGFKGDVNGRSVTALEIEFGVLESIDQNRGSRFYFRDSLPYDRMDLQIAATFSDKYASDKDALDRYSRLQMLKSRINEKMLAWGIPEHVRSYKTGWNGYKVTDLEDWGKQVLEDLWQDIDEETHEYQAFAPDNWQQQESQTLEQFIETQCRNFVGREDLINRLYNFATSPFSVNGIQGICLVGNFGSGKSSIFAKLVRELEQQDILLLTHAAGVSERSVQVEMVLRRWISELAAHLDILDLTGELTTCETLEQEFSKLLSRAAADQRVVCLLDALNQFEDTQSGHYVTWFPLIMHPNVRLIATTIPGTESMALNERLWIETIELTPINELDIRDIVSSLCRRYHKTLYEDVVDILIAKKLQDGSLAAGSPLWLELAVEELLLLDNDDFARMQRDFTGTPEQQLHALLRDVAERLPADIESLYAWMLERIEQLHGQLWVRGCINLITLSRRGWRESDIETLSKRLTDKPWDPLRFAALRRSIRAHLVQRGAQGQWDFFHAQTRTAVLRRNLADTENIQHLHSIIADHLESLYFFDPVHETDYMYHLIGANDRLRAARYYSSHLTVKELFGASHCLVEHIASGGDNGSNTGLDWVISLLSQSEITPEQTGELCSRYLFVLLHMLNDGTRLVTRLSLLIAIMTSLQRLAASDFIDKDWQRNLSICQVKIGDIRCELGDTVEAMELYQASLMIMEKLSSSEPSNTDWQQNLAESHDRIGDMQSIQGDTAGALESYQKSFVIMERLARAEPSNADWQRNYAWSLFNLGTVHHEQSDLAGALKSFQAFHVIAKRLAVSDPSNTDWQQDLSVIYSSIGEVYCEQGNLAEALESYQASLEIAQKLATTDPGNANWQQNLAGRQIRIGDVLSSQGDTAKAMESYQVSLKIAKIIAAIDPGNVNWQGTLVVSQSRIGQVWCEQGYLAKGLESYQKSLEIAIRLVAVDIDNVSWQQGLSVIHSWIGDVLIAQGDTVGALESYRTSLVIMERLNNANPSNLFVQQLLAGILHRIGDVLRACWESGR